MLKFSMRTESTRPVDCMIARTQGLQACMCHLWHMENAPIAQALASGHVLGVVGWTLRHIA